MHYTLEGVKSELPYYQEILLFYKVDPCPLLHTKDNKDTLHKAQDQLCFHYHQQSERRRKVFSDKTSSMLYQPLKCPFAFQNSPCPKEDNCEFSHNETELSFHPLYYKTEPCSGCPYETNSKYCPCYHSDENSRKNVLEKFRSKMIKNTFRNHQNSANIEEATSNLDRFKAKPCQIKGSHNPKVCEYYHHEKDRKRPVSIYNYTINMCSYVEKNRPCPSGDDCGSCHNKVEQLYHPQKYKKKFCTDHPHNLHKCEYGNFCSFAHSENEIQIELLHNMKKDSNFYLYKYKTVFCPYIYGHDRNHCVYAHNPQDFRRDPTKYSYNPVQCQNWSKKQIYSYEDGGCPDEMQCRQCHGWKELEYNPLYYKTELCRNISKCGKRGDCPFYHSEDEQRKGLTHQILLNPANNSIPFGKENLYFINQNIQNQDKTTKTSNYHFGSTKTTINEMPLQMNTNGPKEAHPRFTSNFPKNIIVNNYVPQDKKNTRFKNMSLQHKSGHLVNPMIPRMERPKGLSVGNESLVSENFQCNFIQQEETIYNDFKPLGSEPSSKENELNKSIDSLHSFTGEESKPSDLEENQEVGDAQFVDNLLRNLEKKELEHETATLQSRFAGIKLKNDSNEEDDITFGEQDSRRNRFDASDTFQRSSY